MLSGETLEDAVVACLRPIMWDIMWTFSEVIGSIDDFGVNSRVDQSVMNTISERWGYIQIGDTDLVLCWSIVTYPTLTRPLLIAWVLEGNTEVIDEQMRDGLNAILRAAGVAVE